MSFYGAPQLYGHPTPTPGMGNQFALIVVLFILLVIVGTAYVK